MKPVYRTCFELAARANPTLEAIRQIVVEWASSRPGFFIPVGLNLLESCGPCVAGEGREIESRLYSGTQGRVWGLRLTNPDSEPQVVWTSETTIRQCADGPVWVSCSLSVGRTDDSLSPIRRPANRPRVVRDILASFPGAGMLPLLPEPLGCGDEEVPVLLELLESIERRHPVIFVSSTDAGTQLCDDDKLADTHSKIDQRSVGTRVGQCDPRNTAGGITGGA